MNKSFHKTQKGNVIFFILIAVALFAALTYAVTSSTFSEGKRNKSEETAALGASFILQYVSNLEFAIDRAIAAGCKKHAGLNMSGMYDSDDLPDTPDKCNIFGPNGYTNYLKIPARFLDEKWEAEPFYGDVTIQHNTNLALKPRSSRDSGDITIPYLKREVCQEINENIIGIDTIPVMEGNIGFQWQSTFVIKPGGFRSCPGSGIGDYNRECGKQDLACMRIDKNGEDAYVLYKVMFWQND